MSEFVSAVTPSPAEAAVPALWYVIRRSELLVDEDGDQVPQGPRPDVDADVEPIYLGALDGAPCWAIGVPPDTEAGPGRRWDPLQPLGMRLPEILWALSGRAVQLVEWDRTHRYCGRCGSATVTAVGERAKRCPSCGLLAFPRLAPAIIVLVRRGEQALLAHGRSFPGRMFSTLAGFVEPGETLEQAVEREVFEEVGVRVTNVTYFGSQPWPFPHSLMVGYLADWKSGDIVIDPVEIVEARWFERDEMPPIPPSMSIARRLINSWLVD
jgi:NAD+ diphosphatase